MRRLSEARERPAPLVVEPTVYAPPTGDGLSELFDVFAEIAVDAVLGEHALPKDLADAA